MTIQKTGNPNRGTDMNEKQRIEVTPDRVMRAARLGVDILMTPGAAKVDTVTALQGDLGILSLMLQGIAKGELTVAPPAPPPREDPAKPIEDKENAEHQ